MDGYIEDMLDKQVEVGGSAVCCDSLSFICGGCHCAYVCA